MKIKIDKHGCLHIERKVKMKSQECPYKIDTACWDWCPLFNDSNLPEELDLCHAYYHEFELIDERE